MRFSKIVGHEDVKARLVASLTNNHIAHAQLFFGSEGSANLELALAFLTFLNCENKSDNDSCGECPSCSKMDKLIHPDLHFIFPNTGTKKITGDKVQSKAFLTEWREIVLKQPYFNFPDWMKHLDVENKQGIINVRDGKSILNMISLKAFEAEYKAVVIWLPEMMNQSCANAILKLLEEPPEKTLFFLVSYDFERLLPTILSRTQQLYVPQFSDDEVQSYLKDNVKGVQNIDQVVRLAEGNMNLAIKLAGHQDNNLFSFFTRWLRVCYSNKPSEIFQMADEFQKLGREGQKNLFIYGLKLMRNVLLQNVELDSMIKLTSSEMEFIGKITKIMDLEGVEKISEIINELHYHISRNANAKIVFSNKSLKIGQAFSQK